MYVHVVWSPKAVKEYSSTDIAYTKIHPWVRLAWGIVSAACKVCSNPNYFANIFLHTFNQVVQAQAALDDDVRNLIDEMDKSCKIAAEADPLKGRSPRFQEILKSLLAQVSECAYFVTGYCRDKSFGTCSDGRCRDVPSTPY